MHLICPVCCVDRGQRNPILLVNSAIAASQAGSYTLVWTAEWWQVTHLSNTGGAKNWTREIAGRSREGQRLW